MTTLPLELFSDVAESWTTDPLTKNQTPADWTRNSLPNGETQLWPTKQQNGQTVAAIVQRQPECVHKLARQLPPNEQAGGTDALLWPGHTQTYKIFHGPSSTRMTRTINGLAVGRRVKLTAALLPDVGDIPRGPSGQLESDHCRCEITLRGMMLATDSRIWQTLKTARDYPGVNRPWNVVTLTTIVPPSGGVVVEVSVQQNWGNDPTGANWFFGPFALDYVDSDPIPPPPPVPAPTPTPTPTPAPGNEILTLSILHQSGFHDIVLSSALSALRAQFAETSAVLSIAETTRRASQIIVISPDNSLQSAVFVSRVIGDAEELGIQHEVYRPSE